MSEPTALSCEQKRAYGNQAEAWATICKMRARQQDTERLKPYQWEECGKWHLGHTPPGAQS